MGVSSGYNSASNSKAAVLQYAAQVKMDGRTSTGKQANKIEKALQGATRSVGGHTYIDKQSFLKAVIKHYVFDEDFISHGGPGSGRYPKGYKMPSTIMKEAKSSAKAVSDSIPQRYDYERKSHPDYSALTDEYMTKVANRKALEMRYADAVGESKSHPSTGKIAKESLQTLGAMLAIGLSIASIVDIARKPPENR